MIQTLAKLAGEGSIPISVGMGSVYLDLREFFQVKMALGLYETELEAIIQQSLRPGDIYVDVGAQLGFTALQAFEQIGPAGRALLIDADPRAIRGLKRMIRSIPREKRPKTRVVHRVCSDAPGQTLDFELLDVVGHSKVSTGGDQRRVAHFEIETVSLDGLLENLRKPVRFMKIDVEGHEISVLKGMQCLLSERRVEVLVLEKNLGLLEQSLHSGRDLFSFLTHFGYSGYSLEHNEPIDDNHIESNELENWVFCRDASDLPASIREEVLHRTGQWKENAERDFEQLRQGEPEWKSRLIPIVAMVRGGDVDGGIKGVQELLEHWPDACEARGHYAHWLAARGRIAESRAQYEDLLRRNPENADAKAQLDLLASLNNPITIRQNSL